MDLTERGVSTRRHPWEVQRFEAYRRVLASHGALEAPGIVDVGAGDGWFVESLAPYLAADAHVTCWDLHYADEELVTADPRITRTADRPTGCFDLVLALDVLEHIDDPSAFILGDLAAISRPGAHALVAVPAYQRLFSAHDTALGHHRRYARRRLLDEVAPWLEVRDHGSLFATLVPARATMVLAERIRRRERDTSGVGGWSGGPTLTRIVNSALAMDARAGRALSRRGVRLPGLSHWAYGVVR